MQLTTERLSLIPLQPDTGTMGKEGPRFAMKKGTARWIFAVFLFTSPSTCAIIYFIKGNAVPVRQFGGAGRQREG